MERLQVLLFYCLMVCCLLPCRNVLATQNVTSVQFDLLETFLSGLQSNIYHMEMDLYKNDGSLLFVDGHSIKSTSGNSTEIIVGSPSSSGYQEGIGTSARFSYVTGFKQINASHVAIADRNNHCIRMLNRETNATSLLAGVCKSAGFTNGKSGQFTYHHGIEIDPSDHNNLLVTDRSNSALRSVHIPTGVISTVLSTGLKSPRSLSWNLDKTSLFITNEHYITEVNFDPNGTVTSNVILAGTTSIGSTEGAFRSARFYYPYDITPISVNLNIVADTHNNRVRILNTLTNRTEPVCLSNATICNYLTVSYPRSVLVDDTDVYIGSTQKIYKLSRAENKCSTKNVTAYIQANEDTVEVKISERYRALLSVGTHKYRDMQAGDKCGEYFYIHVQETPVVRTLAFEMKYDINCSSVDNQIAKSFLKATLTHRTSQLLKLCGSYCKMSEKIQPFYTCDGGVMKLTWPTNQVYPLSVNSVPKILSDKLKEKLKLSHLVHAELFILSHRPPLVLPKKNTAGETIDVVIYSSCLDKSKTYRKSGDECV